jgi:16S rRNA (guanine966-N2)-methyltransferase
VGEQRVRIVAGAFKGRRLVAPPGTDTRPTTDRVREALFSGLASRLGTDLGGASVLDAFAGSGALGLEALSRGASHATFVERERRALEALESNVAALGVSDSSRVLRTDAFALPRHPIPGQPFSLLLLDPPYRIPSAEVGALILGLARSGALAPGCVVTWEHSSAADVVWPEGFSAVSSKRYGDVGVEIAEMGTGVGSA